MVRRAAFAATIALLVVWAADVPSSQRAATTDVRLLIAPDHLFEELRSAIDSATTSIDLRTHSLDNADLVDAIVSRQLSGVRVRVVLERGPTMRMSDQERWAARQIVEAGGAVFVRQPSSTADVPPLQHARFIVIDEARALVGSEDLNYAGMPADNKSDGTAGRRGIYVLLTNRTIADQLKTTLAEALKPSGSHTVLPWNFADPAHGVPPASFQPDRTSGGNEYRVVSHASLGLDGSVPLALVGCHEPCVSEPDGVLALANRAGPGDTMLVELHQAGSPSPRLDAFITAARRGAAVRILLDRVDDDPGDARGNSAAVRRVNAAATTEALNLEVRLANPTKGGIHSGMVLADIRGARYVHLGSLSGAADPPGTMPRAIGIQLRSDDAYFFLEEIFTNDWAADEGTNRLSDSGTSNAGTVREMAPGAFLLPRTAAPPAGSPLTRGEHPRIFVTRDELPGLRDRVAGHYASELQEFLDLLAGPSLSSQQRRVEAPWGAFNYALVALLDPDELRRRGFRLDSGIDTTQELCARSWSYASRLLADIAKGEDQSHSALATDLADPLYFPVIAAYDWCNSQWAAPQRQQVADAFVSSWAENWRGKDPLTARGVNGMVANNIASADIHDVLGILAFYGDGYPDHATQSALYETFERVWFDRLLVEVQYFYGPGTGWHEGSGGYLKEGHLNLGLPFAMISTALGRNYFVDIPFFAQYPTFVAANIKPHGQSSDNGRKARYLERWGVISDGISGIGCRGLQLSGGMLARSGDVRAGLARWLHLGEYERRSCADEMRRRGELWVNAGLYWFLFGDRHIEAVPPEAVAPPSLRFGLGEYVFRSDWSPAATQLIAWATPWDMYGHEPRTDAGQFTLHKFGNLILHAGNGKSGDGVVDNFVATNLARNVIGIRRDSDPILKFAPARTFDPFWISRGLDRIELRGALIADQIGGPLDYVAFDASLMWTERGDAVERELAYLRGPTDSEFVVVLDRVALANESDVPVWKVWTAADTSFSDGDRTLDNPQAGMWEASGRPVARVVNQRSGLQTDDFESPDTHGALFVTPVWPDRVRMRILGGPGREFQDLDGGTPFGTPEMTDGSREYLGWGRVETWPIDRGKHHVFLHVLQPGDSRTLSAPTPVTPLSAGNGAWVGAVIESPVNPWIVIFRNVRGQEPPLPLRYPDRPGVRQAVFNLPPNMPIRVEHVGGEVIVGGEFGTEVMVSPAGVLLVEAAP